VTDALYFLGCRSIGALEAAGRAAEEFERQASVQPAPGVLPGAEEDEPDGTDTVFRALTWGPLNASYERMFAAWYDTPPNAYLPLEALAGQLKLYVSQVQARFSKLSARLKRVATPAELADHRKTALGLLVETAYAAETTSHRLTPAGRAAVRRYLGR
jgi:hypothetical protein